jgi:hypothetical protein
LMNTVVAAMLATPGASAKTAGFLDHAVKTVLGPVLEAVQGKGYSLWFWIMAFLHPLALIILWAGKVHRPASNAVSSSTAN